MPEGAPGSSDWPKMRKRGAPKGGGDEEKPLGVIGLRLDGGLGMLISAAADGESSTAEPIGCGSLLLNMLRSEKLMTISGERTRLSKLQPSVFAGIYRINCKIPADLLYKVKYSLGLIQQNSLRNLRSCLPGWGSRLPAKEEAEMRPGAWVGHGG